MNPSPFPVSRKTASTRASLAAAGLLALAGLWSSTVAHAEPGNPRGNPPYAYQSLTDTPQWTSPSDRFRDYSPIWPLIAVGGVVIFGAGFLGFRKVLDLEKQYRARQPR